MGTQAGSLLKTFTGLFTDHKTGNLNLQKRKPEEYPIILSPDFWIRKNHFINQILIPHQGTIRRDVMISILSVLTKN